MLDAFRTRRRLPSLNALKSFEAAARHGSFSIAAEELSVTQTAVSHQIRSLEDWLGIELFVRRPRSLTLTDEGRVLADFSLRAFDSLADGIEKVKAAKSHQRILTVGISPTCGQLWLAHRLDRFWRRYPDIELRVHHSVNYVDVNNDVDIAVRLGRGRWSGTESEFMIEAHLAPFCSPTLLEGSVPLRTPDDLRHHTLLHAYDYELWSHWLESANVRDIDCERGPIIDDPFVLERAAVDGRGVALCPLSLLGNYLKDGRLVRAFPENPKTDFAFYVVYAPGALKRRKVKAFRDFLLEEAHRSSDFPCAAE